METKGTVLLVVPGSKDGERMGRWLEEAGYQVMTCPGPQENIDCLGLHTGRCPLAVGADVVVLDMGPGDYPWGPVLPGWQLLEFYSELGLPVVAVVPWGIVVSEDPVFPVERPSTKEELLGAVAASLSDRFVLSG